MLVAKCLKYMKKHYIILCVYLLVMFFYMNTYIYYVSQLVNGVKAFDFKDIKHTYKVENIIEYNNENGEKTISVFDYIKKTDVFKKYESINKYTYVLPINDSGIIQPEEGDFIKYSIINYIPRESNKLMELSYRSGGWFSEDNYENEIILGNAWAEYYDVGDSINVYYGYHHEFIVEYKVVGILEYGSAPFFSNTSRLGTGESEKGENDLCYISGTKVFKDLENDFYYYSENLAQITNISSLIVTAENKEKLLNEFSDKNVLPIKEYYKNNLSYLLKADIVKTFLIYFMLSVFGIIVIAFSSSKKSNLLYYILAINGISRKRFIVLNSFFVFLIVVVSLVPGIIYELIKFRLMYENIYLRMGILFVTALLSIIVYIIGYIFTTRKKLQQMYKENFEN